MACGQVVGRFPFVLSVPSTETVISLLAHPLLIIGGKAFDYALTIDRVTGNAAAIAATALFEARTDVIASVDVGTTYANAQGTTHHVTDLTGITNRYFAQPVVLARLQGGSTPGTVSGTLSVVLRSCGQPIGTREADVEPNQTNGAPKVYRIGRVSASGGDKLRAALVCNGMKDIEYLFLVRGVLDPEAPGPFVPIGSFATLTDGASAICKADASISGVTPANFHLLEFALSLRMKSGGANPAGFVRVSAGLSYT